MQARLFAQVVGCLKDVNRGTCAHIYFFFQISHFLSIKNKEYNTLILIEKKGGSFFSDTYDFDSHHLLLFFFFVIFQIMLDSIQKSFSSNRSSVLSSVKSRTKTRSSYIFSRQISSISLLNNITNHKQFFPLQNTCPTGQLTIMINENQ